MLKSTSLSFRVMSGLNMAAALTVFCGCASLPADAIRRLEQAQVHYDGNRFVDSKRALGLVISNYPETKGIDAAYYLRGMCYYREHRQDSARADFELALRHSNSADITARASAQMGHIAYQRKAFAAASRSYAQAIDSAGDAAFMDQVYYRYGDSLQKAGRWEAGRKVLPKVWTLYPNSTLVGYAKMKFGWPHQYHSIQCGAFNRSDLAQGLANNLRRQGFDASSEVNLRGQRVKHVVHVGRYRVFKDAESDLPRVRQHAADAFIVP